MTISDPPKKSNQKRKLTLKPGDMIAYCGYNVAYPHLYYMNKNVTEIDLKKVIVKFFNDVIGLPIEYEHADAIYILARAATKEIREEHDLNLKKLGFKDRTI